MKIALVTGAAKGLGLAWCKLLGQQGYTVILTARSQVAAEQAAQTLVDAGLKIHAKALEVSSEEQLRELAVWVNERFGQMDLIINNAGINPKDYSDKTKMAKAFYLDALDAKEMLDVLHVNSLAPLLVVKHFRTLLRKSVAPCVINISSWLGSVSNLSFGGHYGYVGSKNLLNVLTKSMANELKPDNIVCIAVNPGWVQTDMGGAKARFSPEEACFNIFTQIITKASLADSGKFLNFDGTEHPW